MPTQRSSSSPFQFCASACVLLACAVHQFETCKTCEPTTTYVADPSGLTRKHRKPKRRELRQPLHHTWTVGPGVRTAKHKVRFNGKKWCPDSGANVSVISDISMFHSITDSNPGRRVQVANKQFVDVLLVGNVKLNLTDKRGRPYSVLLENVLYSPKFSGNLLSVEELHKQHKIETRFRGKEGLFVTPDGYEIPFSTEQKSYVLHANALREQSTPELWHRRFCHAGTRAMQRVGKCFGIAGLSTADFSKCDLCLQGGAKHLPLNIFDDVRRTYKSHDRAERTHRKKLRFTYFGQRISVDLCEMPIGFNGHRYMLILHDSFTGNIYPYSIKNKTKEDVLAAIQLFISDNVEHLERGIGQLHSDNGSEFCNADMELFCEELAIKRTYTVPYMPSQNPYVERANQTVLRPLRTMLAESKQHGCDCEKFWPVLIKHIATVHNMLPNDECESGHKMLHGEHFDYRRLRTPCTLCYYLLPQRELASKLSPRAVHAICLGLDHARKGYFVWVPSLHRFTTAYHLVFNEYKYYDPSLDRNRTVNFEDEITRSEGEPIGVRMRKARERTETRDGYQEERDDTDGMPPQVHERVRLQDDIHLPQPESPADDPRHGRVGDDANDPGDWNEDHCSNSKCVYPRGHSGPCSHEDVAGRPRTRKRVNEAIYNACRVDGCACIHDHCGSCIDENGRRIKSVEAQLPGLAQSIKDADSVLDFDPMESTFAVHIDDVCEEVLLVQASSFFETPCPKVYEDTQTRENKETWDASMLEEHNALLKNDTWEYVSRFDPKVKGRKPTKSRWVYTIKYDRNGSISRFKSRFVVCGYSQRQGIDYDRAFSATLRATTFRTLLAIAAGKKMRLMQFDVSNAFTQAKMDDVDVYVEPAKGFEVWEWIKGKPYSMLLKLKRALYGTKQASRLWQETLRAFLTSNAIGFVQSTADPCLFHLKRGDDEIILGIYVDDILVAYRGKDFYNDFHAKFFKRFGGTSNKLEWFLGMRIDQHEDYSIHLDHSQSILKMGQKFMPHDDTTRDFLSPDLFSKLERAQTDAERAKVREFQYASKVGAILYIAVMSRPDVAYYASVLAKYLADPSDDCCKAATHLMQYLVATRKRRMYFSGKVEVPEGLRKHTPDIERNCGFVAYSDSSWGNKYPYPMFGYGIYLYGGLISYSSKQLKTVAFSSCEAEYAAASYACKEVEFVRNICADMGIILQGRLVLAVDNTAAIDIAHDVGVSARTKHFDRAIHYLRDLTQLKRILPTYINTHDQRADGYTKPLDKSTFATWFPHVIRLPHA